MEKSLKMNVLIIFYKSSNHDMYKQGIKKTTLSIFDDKRNYLDNISIPCN